MRYYNQTALRPAVAGYFVFIALGILCVYKYGIEHFRPETIRDAMLSLNYWGPLIYVLCNAFRPFFFFPAFVLALAGGLAFGPLWGTVYLVTGTALGAALCFGAARLAGRDRMRRWRPGWLSLAELDGKAARHGFRTVLMLRLAPVLPWDAVSFLAGLSGVRFWPYISATVIGSVPGAVAICFFGNALFESLSTAVVAAVVIAAAAVCFRLLGRGGRWRGQ